VSSAAGHGRSEGGDHARAKKPQTRCEVLSSPERVREVLEANRDAGRVALELEPEGTEAVGAALAGVGLCFEPGSAYYVPLGVSEPEALLDELRPLLGPDGPPKVAHDAKFGLVVLGQRGVEIGPPGFDTLIAAFLLDGRSAELEELAATRLGAEEQLGRTCARADSILRLCWLFEAELEERGQLRYLRELELPIIPVLAEMELAGISIDSAALEELSRDLEVRLRELEAEMEEVAGRPVNPRSPRQLGEILYEDLGLEGSRKTSSGRFSTDALALEALAGQHPIIEKILEHRSLSRLKDAYADTLPRLVNPETGRVHTSFSQVSASSGRLASSNPNLQNIPVRTELGREIRRAFVADDSGSIVPGPTVLLSGDYSQIELRVLAHITGEPALVEAFASGEDVHALTAARLYGVPPEEVTTGMRRIGKMLN
jgi:DNA polymerase I